MFRPRMTRRRVALRKGTSIPCRAKCPAWTHPRSHRARGNRVPVWLRRYRSNNSTPGGIRTPDPRLRRQLLYPLSYGRAIFPVIIGYH